MTSDRVLAADQGPPRAATRWASRTQFFCAGFIFATWGVHIPTVKAHYGIDEAQLGLALLAAGVGALLGISQAGRVIGRHGARFVCGLCGTVYALLLTGLIAMPGLAGLLALLVLFGLVTRLPFAFAAGLGINSFLAVAVVGQVTWPEAMGLVVINGLIIVLLAATGLRRMIFNAVPIQLKLAITVGIGLFIAFIGFVDAGFVTATGTGSPPVGLGIAGRRIAGVEFVGFLDLAHQPAPSR